jgi:chromosome segregation ATPase
VFARLLNLLIVLIGALGVVVCVAAAVVVWFTSSRLTQVNDRVFDRIDTVLAGSRDRVLDAQKRVQDSKITMQDVRQGIEGWARKEAAERLTSRLELENKVERLAAGLRQCDVWLELSGASLQGVQQALDVTSSLGAPADAALLDPLLERLGALRDQLKQSTDAVDTIRARLDQATEGETLEERISRLAQLALRVVATLSDIDSRLGQFADGIVATQAKAEQLKNRTHGYIITAEVCAMALIAWMAVGQVFLGRYGWIRGNGGRA